MGLLTPSQGLFEEVADIHDDYLLNVSPFILSLLSSYIADSENNSLDRTVFDVVNTNRDLLLNTLQGTKLVPIPSNHINVAWLRIDDEKKNAEGFMVDKTL